MDEVLDINKDAAFMFENVVVSNHLPDDAEEQERLIGWTFEHIDALDCGAAQSRPRRVAQNLVAAGEWESRPAVDPNVFLNNVCETGLFQSIGNSGGQYSRDSVYSHMTAFRYWPFRY